MIRYDLHTHSTCSDGSLSPEELLRHAKEEGLQGISITDHDTVEAYETAPKIAQELGLGLITGVEFSAAILDATVHILAYSFSPDSPYIQGLCARHKERREKRNLEMIDLLAKEGIYIDYHMLKRPGPTGKTPTIGRPHMAKELIKQGVVKSIPEAFKKYLGDDAPCYVPGQRFSVGETLDVIHSAEGIAVIAHPHLIKKSKVIHTLLELDFDGIEAHYAGFGKHEAEKWAAIAREKEWLITGGSDFHGEGKPHNRLGISWAPEETIPLLQP